MIRTAATTFAASITFVLCMDLGASAVAGDLMPPTVAARLGLEEVWRKQLAVPAGTDSIVDQQIVVHKENQREFIEVRQKTPKDQDLGALFRIATDSPNSLGQPIGKDEAERLARREVRRLTRRYGELEITSSLVPRIHLYTLANNGSIDCRDAESGEPVWMTQAGNGRLIYGKLGIDDHHLTFTNGGNLVQLDISNGEPIETIRTENIPLYGTIIAGDWTMIPTIRNGIEGYPLSDITDTPFMRIVSGMAMVPPVKSPSSTKIAWGTDGGFVYVMETSGEPSVLFRLDTDGIVSGQIATDSGDRFYFGSDTGQAYAVRATRMGVVIWNRPLGEPFYKAPLLLESTVLMVSEYGNLFSLDKKSGLPTWEQPTPNVDSVLGGFADRVFVRLLTGAFAMLDATTGETLDVDPSFRADDSLVNRATDRLYFVNRIGTVQCLRAVGAESPKLKVSLDATPEVAEDSTSQPGDPMKKTESAVDPFNPGDPFAAGGASGGGDPFGAGPADAGGAMGGDPFGAGGAADDPFGAPSGGADDPFGAPAGGAMNDPFGDPFGG